MPHRRRPSRRLTLSLGALGAVTVPAVHAQSDAAPSAAAASAAASAPQRSTQLDTVLVTAQKRREDASKVPISMSVLGGDALLANRITDLTDVTRAVPNVSFSSQGFGGAGPGLHNIEIRGVASSAGSNTTGIYLDDVSMTTLNLFSLGAAEPKFFDLDRIEVLRGPQGTLYGAGSMGGTVKFVSRQPDLRSVTTDVDAEFSSTRGGGLNYQVDVARNQPLIPGELALRIGVLKGRQSGYIDQVDSSGKTIASNINSENDAVLRLAAKWTPTPALTITPSLFYQEVHTGDIDAGYLDLPANQTSKTVLEPATDRLTVPSLTVNADLGPAELTSVTSYFRRIFNRIQDGTTVNNIGYDGAFISTPPAGLVDAVGALSSTIELNNLVHQFSQEVRLASKPYEAGGSPLTWIGGGYYANLHTTLYDNEQINGVQKTFDAFDADPATLLGFATPNDAIYQSLRRYKTEQYAVFGELTYHLMPTLYATAGLRYLRSRGSIDQDVNYYWANGPHHVARGSSDTAATPKVALTWDVDPANTVYATAAKGTRVGGENRFVPAGAGQQCNSQTDDQARLAQTGGVPDHYAPDSLWSYELGSKSRLLDNRLTVNLAAFYIDWSRLQQNVLLPNCGFDYTINLGRAKSIGYEAEIKGKPISNLVLGLSGGYTHATLSEDAPALDLASGAPVAGVPRYNASLSAEYSFGLVDNVAGFVRASSDWIGPSHGSPFPTDPDYERPSYNTVNLSVGATVDAWQVSVFAKNLFNNQKVIQRPNVEFVDEGYRLRPLTVGLSVSGSL